jgi:hypothetical protein
MGRRDRDDDTQGIPAPRPGLAFPAAVSMRDAKRICDMRTSGSRQAHPRTVNILWSLAWSPVRASGRIASRATARRPWLTSGSVRHHVEMSSSPSLWDD